MWELGEEGWIERQRKAGAFQTYVNGVLARVTFRGFTKIREHVLAKRSQPRASAPRKPSLAAALREAKQAWVAVAAATITGEGVALTFGEVPAGSDANPWDEVLKNVANKKRTS